MATQDTFDNAEKESRIIEMPLETVLPKSMMPYAEYIIMNRALPRVEDGLKPVQRRILYSMYTLGLKPDTAYKKSARVVGDCLGKYHPHGDKSVYDAMVRMAQDFNMGMTLIDGHGNFGSIDGDTAAAMRYTEVRLEKLACELLKDIEKDTVKWDKNFDDTMDEPNILPGRFPNLLVNGASGIAIGLATNIPPHNLSEVIDAVIELIDQPKATLERLLQIIKGPDFPTGGYIIKDDSLYDIYKDGVGKVVMRAKVDIENITGGRQNIIITEIPYQENKSKLEQRIYELKEKKKDILGGIIDVADESDRNGMRIVIKLKKGEDAVKILDYLYKNSNLQCNFPANMVAIAGGKPRQMGLLEILKYYIEFQRSIIQKRCRYDLGVAEKRAHILMGFTLILPDHIDETIELIKTSSSRSDAKIRLKDRFELSEAQADAILSLQLSQLTKLDIRKFENELNLLKTEIATLKEILSSNKNQLDVVKKELLEIKEKFGIIRRTVIVENINDIEVKPFDANEKNMKKGYFSIDAEGKVKFMLLRQFLKQNRELSANGYSSITKALALADIDREVLIFGSHGNCYRFNTVDMPEKKWEDAGFSLYELDSSAPKEEKAVALIGVNADIDIESTVFVYTLRGMVKQSKVSEFLVSKSSYQVMTLKDDDYVINAEASKANTTILFITSDGMCVNSEKDDIPLQGRKAGGVKGVSLTEGESIVLATQCEGDTDDKGAIVQSNGEITLLSDKGYAKRVLSKSFDVMKRARKGIKIFDLAKINGEALIFAYLSKDPVDIALIDENKIFRGINSSKIRVEARNSKGSPIIKKKDLLLAVRHFEEDK